MSEEPEQKIVVRLVEQQDALWRKFASHTNEMITTNKGKKMFPTLDYHIEGLDDDKIYEMVLEFHQVDDFCYQFYVDRWVDIGGSKVTSVEANDNAKKIRHLNGMRTGKEWMSFAVNFDNVKLSTTSTTKNPLFVYLRALQKYVPVLTIYEVSINLPTDRLTSKSIAVIKFDYTEFIAVRSYRNPVVKALKVAKNPFCELHRQVSMKRRFSSVESSAPPKKKNIDVESSISLQNPMLPTFSQFLAMRSVPLATIPFFKFDEVTNLMSLSINLKP